MPDLKHSISEISKIITTNGSMPVVVMADDLEDYICKYDFVNKLINEYLCHRFLEIWGLPVLPAHFIKIKPEHVKKEFLGSRLQLHHFEKPSFGLKYESNSVDVANTLLGLKSDYNELSKFKNRLDILKIALFDIWIANTDRNHNNYNILLIPDAAGYQFYPIDHSDAFDGGRLGNELAQLTEFDSILSSDLIKVFVSNKRKVDEYIAVLLANFSTFASSCGELLREIVKVIPIEWCNDKDNLEKSILSSIITNKAWLSDTENNFKELIHQYIR